MSSTPPPAPPPGYGLPPKRKGGRHSSSGRAGDTQLIQLPTTIPVSDGRPEPGRAAPGPQRPRPEPNPAAGPPADPPELSWPAAESPPGLLSRIFRSQSIEEVERRNHDRSRVGTPIPHPLRIGVVGLKGGVGKTTLSVLLSSLYTQLRAEPVLLLDADPTYGSLLVRTGITPTHSAQDVSGKGDPGSLAVLVPYLSRSAQGAWVLANGLDPGQSAGFDEARFVATMDVVYRHFPLMVFDAGAGLSGGLMAQLLGAVHTLVVATLPTVDSIRATYEGLAWIAERGFQPLVASSVVVVTGVRRRDAAVDLDVAVERFEGLCRRVLSVPEDPHLSAGGLLDPAELSTQTRAAVMRLAAEALEAALSRSGPYE